MNNKITFVDESDGSISVYLYGVKIMRIEEIRTGDVRTKIFGSFESISLSSVKATKKFILDMYKGGD